MHYSVMTRIFWAAGFVPTAVLLVVLLWRRRWRQFPFFSLWIAFIVVRTSVLFSLYMANNHPWYARVYYTGLWLDFALQLGVAIEIARTVLRPTGTWIHDAKSRFALAGLGGAAVAALVSWLVSPPASTVPLIWMIRGNLFTSLVICELFVAMSFTANRLGLGWRHHVMALGQGLTAWTSIMVVTTALQSLVGPSMTLDYVRETAFTAAMLWIVFQLWRPEPERLPIAPELREYILALHRRVEYDFRRLDAQQ